MTKDQIAKNDDELRKAFYCERRWEIDKSPPMHPLPDVCIMGYITYEQFIEMIKRFCEGTALFPSASPFIEWNGVKICVSHRMEEGMTFGHTKAPQ